jgi:hypothetical protein
MGRGERQERPDGDIGDEDFAGSDEAAGPHLQPRLRDLARGKEMRQFWLEFKDQDRIEEVRCHEMVAGDGVVRFLLHVKGGRTSMVVLYPLTRIQTIEEHLYDEENWESDDEYRYIPW